MGDAEVIRGKLNDSFRYKVGWTSGNMCVGMCFYVETYFVQFEVENAALRETNKQQEAQILELQKQVQGKSLFCSVGICLI